MTANAYDTDVKNCIDAGMNAHLSKPIEPKVVFKTLADQIDNAEKKR
jgi:CheY-like chemotaxis protein